MTLPAPEMKKLNVFVSYSRDDLNFADELVAGLQFAGFETSIDRHSVKPGEDWKARLGGLILAADTIVFVISPDSIDSEICAWEVEESRRYAKRIIPVVWRDVEFAKAPLGLSTLNAIPFTQGRVFSGLNQLVEALNSDLDWLREHTRIEQKAQEWNAGSRGAEWLLRGSALKIVQTWLAHKPAAAVPATDLQLAYIRASEEEEAKLLDESRRRLQEQAEAKAAQERAVASRQLVRRTTVGLAAATLLAMVASGLGALAYMQREQAIGAQLLAENERLAALSARELAETAQQMAVAARNETLLIQSKFVTDLAKRELDQGDAVTAVLLALEALPNRKSQREIDRDRPLWPAAEQTLQRAVKSIREGVILRGHSGPVTGVIGLDERRVVTSSEDGTVRIWDSNTGSPIATLNAHTGPVWSLNATADARLFATGSGDGTIRIWDTKTGSEQSVLDAAAGAVTAVSLTSDGTRVIAAYADNVIRVWHSAKASAKEIKGHTGRIHALSVSKDDKLFASASADETARVWNLDGKEIGVVRGNLGAVYAVAIVEGSLRDGSPRVVTGSADGSVRLWTVSSEQQTSSAEKEKANTEKAAEGDARRETFALRGHTSAILSVALANAGGEERILSSSLDKSVRIWRTTRDAERQSERITFKGHGEPVRAVALLPGGRFVTASYDKTARIWELPREPPPNDRKKTDTRQDVSSSDTTRRVGTLTPTAVVPGSTQDWVDHAIAVVHRCLTPSQRSAYNLSSTIPQWCQTTQKWPFDADSALSMSYDHLRQLDSSTADAMLAAATATKPELSAEVRRAQAAGMVWQAEHALTYKDYHRTITLLSNLSDLNSPMASKATQMLTRAHNGLAWQLLHEGKPAEALPHADAAAASDPTNSAVLDTRGHIRLELGMLDGACADFAKSIAGAPAYAGTYYGRGICMEKSGNKESAIADFQKVMELPIEDAFALIAYAKSQAALTRLAKSKP